MTFCLPGSSPSRHFGRREDPGDEVGRKANLELKAIKKLSKTCHKLIKNFAQAATVQRAAVTAEGSFYSFVSGDSTLEFGGGGNTWEIYGIYIQQLTYIFR